MLTICNIAAEDQNTWHLIRSNPTYPNGQVIAQVWWARKGISPAGDPAWVNHNGGYYPDKDYVVVLQTREAGGYWDLPQCDTTEFKQLVNVPHFCRLGWLSPEGILFKCTYFEHDRYANIILGKTVRNLEEAGWIRITGSDTKPYLPQEPNEEQAKFLLDNDY